MMKLFRLAVLGAVILTFVLSQGLAQEAGQKGPQLKFAIKTKTTEPFLAVYKKYVGPYSKIPGAIEELGKWVENKEYVHRYSLLGEYYNSPMEVDSTQLEWAIIIPILEPAGGISISKEGDILIKEIEPILVAYTFHQGPYEEVGPVFGALFGWIVQQGYDIAGPMREVYWSDPQSTPVEKLISEIQIPIRKK